MWRGDWESLVAGIHLLPVILISGSLVSRLGHFPIYQFPVSLVSGYAFLVSLSQKHDGNILMIYSLELVQFQVERRRNYVQENASKIFPGARKRRFGKVH